MRNVFTMNIKIRLSAIILIILIGMSIISGLWYILASDSKLLALLGSLIAGIIVAIIQFLIAWHDFIATDKLKNLQINEVLLDRDKRDFYENYIRMSRKKIDMMGVTGSRFMDHFANDDENSPENAKILLQAMSKGVKVRILVPEEDYLFTSNDKRNWENANERFLKISSKYSDNFQVKYFSHVPAHSVFMVDDECILGPVFPNVSSKFTPALYLKNKSPFAEKYLEYFENEWNTAESI